MRRKLPAAAKHGELDVDRAPVHPGTVLWEEFMKPNNIDGPALAKHIGHSPYAIQRVLAGARGIDADLAWSLAGAFGTTPEFWLNLSNAHYLVTCQPIELPNKII